MLIKQINLLEGEFGVKLFERTHRGLILIKAGKSLYQDTKYIIQYCQDAIKRAQSAMEQDENILRIGTSPMTPAELLTKLWPEMQQSCPNMKFQIIPYANTLENSRELLANLGKNIDVIASIFDEAMLNLRHCAGLELSREPFCCAVSIHHPLASKDRLAISDLDGENLLMMHRHWSHYLDELRDDLCQNHPHINIVDFDYYSTEIFNHCENSNDVLLAIPGWANVHPLLKVLSVDWQYDIPYGLLYSLQPSETVQEFLRAAKKNRNQRTLQIKI